MTELIYKKDRYQKECEALVESACEFEDKFNIVLNKTVCYPQGGGQPGDRGKLIRESDGEEFPIMYCYKFRDEVFHTTEKTGLVVGDKVKVIIDWELRYKHMRFHTATHIISHLVEKEQNTQISSNSFQGDKGRIDFTLDDFDRDYMMSFEQKANDIIRKHLPVSVRTITREEADKEGDLYKLLKGFPEGINEVQIVQIGHDDEIFDRIACGGSHVENTQEIKGIVFLKLENKGAKRRRIVFGLLNE
jgi:misacylated tRNA(Ala) deacylase